MADQQDITYPAIVGSDGRAVVTVWPGNLDRWTISQVSIEMPNAGGGAVCVLRKNRSFVTFLIPTGDAAGGDPPIVVGPSDRMTVEWTNCNPGDAGEVTIFYTSGS